MKRVFLVLCVLLFSTSTLAIDLQTNPEIAAYINKVCKNYHFDKTQVTQWFNQASFDKRVLPSISKPSEVKPWYVYRDILITQARISDGAKFWNQNAKVLAQAEHDYGIPAGIIVAIIGVETNYGTNKGSFSVMNVLTTLAFKYPKRGRFFRSELTEYLLLCREQNWDPLNIKGSYAGAMGYAQFMPSSYRKYALAYDSHSHPNLISNSDDAILSIGNYLKHHGWQPGNPVTVLAKVSGDKYLAVIDPKGKPQYPFKHLQSKGIIAESLVSPSTKVGLISLENKETIEHWLTFNNFKVITTYNNSIKYAMAVYQLGQAIAFEKDEI